MWISRLFFRLISCWPAMLLGNALILGMILYVLYANSEGLSSCIISDLRSETVSTIVIAWGVLLESRHELLGTGLSTAHHASQTESLLNLESKISGLLLVCLGLFLEVLTYFDASTHLQPTPTWVSTVLHGIVWILLAAICAKLFFSCLTLVQIRVTARRDNGEKI